MQGSFSKREYRHEDDDDDEVVVVVDAINDKVTVKIHKQQVGPPPFCVQG